MAFLISVNLPNVTFFIFEFLQKHEKTSKIAKLYCVFRIVFCLEKRLNKLY
jgi:hypothetical protein